MALPDKKRMGSPAGQPVVRNKSRFDSCQCRQQKTRERSFSFPYLLKAFSYIIRANENLPPEADFTKKREVCRFEVKSFKRACCPKGCP